MLRYPDEVGLFIERWFAGRPEHGISIFRQIERRADLQQLATVPSILEALCVVGRTGQLPRVNRDLYTLTLGHLLAGDDDRGPVIEACLDVLRAWAWSAASDHPGSGIGEWADVFLADADPPARHEELVSRVAIPAVKKGPNASQIPRRFIHRAIRSYLVADYVASLPGHQAVEVLLPHLWYDPDWVFAVPAALAMHPHRDYVLGELVRRSARSDQFPPDLSVIDGGWEFRRLLARLSSVSGPADWPPELAALIDRSRAELAWAGRLDDVAGEYWHASNSRIRNMLLAQLARRDSNGWTAGKLVACIIRCAVTAGDRREAREALLRLLSLCDRQSDGPAAASLGCGIARLDPTAQEERQARGVLFGLLARQSWGRTVAELVTAIAQLASAAADRRQACADLVASLERPSDGWIGTELPLVAAELATGLAQLSPDEPDRRRARAVLLALLRNRATAEIPDMAVGWASALAALHPTAEDQRLVRQVLLRLLTDGENRGGAAGLAGALAGLAPAPEEKLQAWNVLLGFLDHPEGRFDDKIIEAVLRIAPEEEGRRQVRGMLLSRLAEATGEAAAWLARALARLSSATDDNRRARSVLLDLLPDERNAWVASELAGALALLSPTAGDTSRAREVLLRLLADRRVVSVVAGLVDALGRLEPSPDDGSEARARLLSLLGGQTDAGKAAQLAGLLIKLDPTADDKRRARAALLHFLAGEGTPGTLTAVAGTLAALDATAEDIERVRHVISRLHTRNLWLSARELTELLPLLQPTVRDLGPEIIRAGQADWPAGLISAVRRNSTLEDWLEALPGLSFLSDLPGEDFPGPGSGAPDTLWG